MLVTIKNSNVKVKKKKKHHLSHVPNMAISTLMYIKQLTEI